MVNEEHGRVISQSEIGVTGVLPIREILEYPVATSTDQETKNTILLPIIPVACWKLEDMCFDFDQVFIRKHTKHAFEQFADLRKEYPQAPISLFGHADPVGNDVYNKKLSEMRAKAVYGVLTRKAHVWEDIYEAKHLQEKLESVGHSPGPIDGIVGSKTKAAILSYMDHLCGKFKLRDADFLGEGSCAYQGCSEFNPVRMFSRQLNEYFKKEDLKEERDLENHSNRRVLAFLFKPGTKMDRSRWPCPSAAEGIVPCKKRFWPDAQRRREFQATGREYHGLRPSSGDVPSRRYSSLAHFYLETLDEDDSQVEHKFAYKTTDDTIACRFYDQLAHLSPCERPGEMLYIDTLLYDKTGAPVEDADYRISIGDYTRTGRTKDGWVREWLPMFASQYTLQWRLARTSGRASDAASHGEYPHSITVPLSWVEVKSSGFGICFGDVDCRTHSR